MLLKFKNYNKINILDNLFFPNYIKIYKYIRLNFKQKINK